MKLDRSQQPNLDWKNRIVAAGAISGIVVTGFSTFFSSVANAAATTYVYASFRGDAVADEKLWIYTSSDGSKFNLFANTDFGGVTGVVRDPSIMKHTDGKYYIAYTVQSWTTPSTYFAIASSPDLLNWTAVATVNSGIGNTKFTWAPEWYIEGSSVAIICSVGTTAGGDFKPYIYTAQNSALTSWSGPASMGIGANHIDTIVVKSGSTYHAFAKDETGKWIQHATSLSLTSGWSAFTNLWQYYEAPAIARMDNGTWRIYVDRYTDGGIWSATSSDLTTWSSLSLVGAMRHGTVLRDTAYGGAAIPAYTTITGRQSLKVLDVQNPNTSDGANVGIYTSNGGA